VLVEAPLEISGTKEITKRMMKERSDYWYQQYQYVVDKVMFDNVPMMQQSDTTNRPYQVDN
jgi:hypothetical protein